MCIETAQTTVLAGAGIFDRCGSELIGYSIKRYSAACGGVLHY